MHRTTSSLLFVLTFGILSFLSCKRPFYSKEIKFPKEIWTYNQPLEYNWSIQDTHKAYDLILYVRHDDQLKYQNIYVRCHSSYPDKSVQTQEVSLELLDAAGKPNGTCNMGTCTAEIPLILNTVFPVMGDYGLKIEQYSRVDSFPGLKAVRFDLVERK